jgi:Fur family transcriptional regulator, ferric uptake regulator
MSSIKHQLTAAGLRLTKPRLEIFAALDHKPQSIVEISHKLIKQKLRINIVTIYRTLESFVKLGLVAQTQFKDQIAVFELADHQHHHHVLCESCGKIEDITLDENLLLSAAKKKSSFQIKSHHLEFFGLCHKCH